MSTDKRSPEFYLDWACRVTEDACAASNLELSDDGKETLRAMWADVAKPLAEQPAHFRAGSAAMKYWLSEAAQFMLKAAEYAGSDSIGPAQVVSGTSALLAARAQAQTACTWCDHDTKPPPPSARAINSSGIGPNLNVKIG